MNLSSVVFRTVGFCLSAGFVVGCSQLPSLADRPSSTAMLDTGATRLGKATAPTVAAHPGKSGIYPLADARDAFSARMLLAQAAERSLDVQYYIWRKDITGTLLFEALRGAADRGVRVRLLLDDNVTSGLDSILAALDLHPNIEIRLFNPLAVRYPRWINYVADFFRLNRRMHNKSFTADNQATIVGARNIGDEYFDATEGLLFVDLDAMAVGPVVAEVSADFDRYWASASSYPVDRLLPPVDANKSDALALAASSIESAPATVAYRNALRNSSFVRDLLQGRLVLEWAPTRMISDDPAKGLGQAPPELLLPLRLKEIIGDPRKEMNLVVAYFVPTAEGVGTLAALAGRGVKVRILTNSLEATDGPEVHSGYAKRRKALLEAGIELYELQRLTPRVERRRPGRLSSSGSSLHAKTFAVDRSRVFIGSFNFDPRSARLNTEMGFVIESSSLAEHIESAFDTGIPANAYRVHVSEAGHLYWTELRDGKLVRYDSEPGTTFLNRAVVWFLSVLPIEWLL